MRCATSSSPPPIDHRTRVLAAADKALQTLFAPPSVLALEERHGLDVLERATTLAADTEMRGKVKEGVGKTLVHYLRATKIPGCVPLTFAQFVSRWGDKEPAWLAPYLVGVTPVRPESWDAVEAERAAKRKPVKPPDEEPENVLPRSGGIEPGSSLARSLVASLHGRKRA